MASKCLFTRTWRGTILTSEVGHTDQVFGFSRSVHTRSQVSVCSSVICATLLTIHPDRQTAFWWAYMNSSANWAHRSFHMQSDVWLFSDSTLCITIVVTMIFGACIQQATSSYHGWSQRSWACSYSWRNVHCCRWWQNGSTCIFTHSHISH